MNKSAMSIPSGVRIGPYEIRSLLGAGGMGEVYRAHDASLNREVAIKIVPERFARDPERMARFQREAKALAALNHPHIAGVYGLEEFRSTQALAMELVEGQTLEELLAARSSGPQGLAIEDALPIARQIADALEYAHERGITHRDLKPANIKIAPDGVVKVLDFGLAKTSRPSPADESEQPPAEMGDDSPTLDLSLTGTGIIVGTAAYMSPEQARGKTVDRRTDIWSFGCVLYEMISGRRPFQGETVGDLLAAVLRAEPDWHALPAETPAPIRELLRRCFVKDPRRRLRDIGDARIAIEETMSGDVPSRVTATDRPATRSTSLRQIVPWVAAGVLLVATLALAILYSRSDGSSPAAIVSRIVPAEGGFDVVRGGWPQLSPDARRLAYVAPGPDGRPLVWVHGIDSTAGPSPLKGTEGAVSPFWSPDGHRIGFFAGRKLMRIEVSGGPPVEVSDVTLGFGGEWTPDDTILFASSSTSPIFRVSANGGKPEAVTALDGSRQEGGHRRPQLLSDNRHFLYGVVSSARDFSGTYVGSLDGGVSKLVQRGDSSAVYAAPGYLLYPQDGAVMAQAFDAKRFEVSGDPIVIAPRRGTESVWSITASNGVLAYLSGQVESSQQLQWFDRTGTPGETVADKQSFYTPRISPNGEEAAVAVASSPTTRDIWIFDLLQSRSPRKLTFDKLHNWSPVWSSDGKTVAFSTNPGGQFHIYGKSADGSGTAQAIVADDASHYVDSWSHDYIAYARGEQKGTPAWDIWALSLSGDRKPFPFLQSAFNKEEPALSPDGNWIAYDADETGNWEVYIAPFPKGDGKWLVSTGGGRQPRWRSDGRELFYMTAENKLVAAEIHEKNASIEIGRRQELFQSNAAPSNFRNYDVTPDGKRFLMITQSPSKGAALNLIVNWQHLLSNREH